MREGHFIGLNDRTTCGGTVLDGDTRIMMYGVAHACDGDRVTCGKDRKTYRIVGGISYMTSHGRPMAGTLDSYSNCPCRAGLIPSVLTATYTKADAAPPVSRKSAEPTAPVASTQPAVPRQSGFAPSSHPAPAAFNKADLPEPGFYVVPNSMTREQLEAALFPSRQHATMSKFQALNPDRSDLKAGSMIVLSDPSNT
ncbi:PAAR domain-containing protein, partial [Pseudomonas umsongensis]